MSDEITPSVTIAIREVSQDGGWVIEECEYRHADVEVQVHQATLDRWRAAETAWNAAQAEMRETLLAAEQAALDIIEGGEDVVDGPLAPVRDLFPAAEVTEPIAFPAPETDSRHTARATNFSNDPADTDWRGSCAPCGWAGSPGWRTPKRKARTRQQAEVQAERHNRVATEREHLISRLMYTVVPEVEAEQMRERLRRLR